MSKPVIRYKICSFLPIIGLESQRTQLLILDEATSAMDKHTERFVLNLLESLRSSMAILSVSHRTDVLQTHCDRVYVLEKGTVSLHLCAFA